MEKGKYFSVKEAGYWVGVAPSTIRRWLEKGLLKKKTFNGYNVVIEKEELENLIRIKEK